jgi:thiol-disulfide isomerase/thioredoxin
MRCWSAKARSVLAVVVSIGVISVCSCRRQNQVIAAPNFELKDLSGNMVRLDSFRGHPVLLDFWATWCGPCRMSIPVVQEFYMSHKADGLVVLGLNMDDDASGVFGFVKHFKMTYPVLLAGNSSTAGDYEVDGIPHFVFIGPDGHIIQVYSGFSFDIARSWEEDLKIALANNH